MAENKSLGLSGMKPTMREEPIEEPMVYNQSAGEIGPISVEGQPVEQLAPVQPRAAEPQTMAPAVNVTSDSPGGINNAINKLNRSYDINAQAGQQAAVQEAAYLDQAAQLQEQRAAQRQQELDQRQELINQRALEMDASQKDYLAAKEDAGKSYWEDRSIGAKIGAAIAQALGAYGATLAGTENFAAKTIENAIKQDTDLKLRKAKLAKDRSLDIAKRYDNLMNQLGDESAIKDAMTADGLKAVQNRIQQVAARSKSKQAQAKALEASGQLDLKIQDLINKAAKKSSVTADQAKAATFGRRLQQAEGVFNKLTAQGYDRSDLTSGLGSMFPNLVRTSSAVEQEQAERNFVNAQLRRESGAAIAESEFESAEKQYFPRVGDSKAVIEQKRKNREQAMKGLLGEAGPGLDQVPLVSGGRILVELPNGKKGSIPQEKLTEYQSKGAKVIGYGR